MTADMLTSTSGEKPLSESPNKLQHTSISAPPSNVKTFQNVWSITKTTTEATTSQTPQQAECTHINIWWHYPDADKGYVNTVLSFSHSTKSVPGKIIWTRNQLSPQKSKDRIIQTSQTYQLWGSPQTFSSSNLYPHLFRPLFLCVKFEFLSVHLTALTAKFHSHLACKSFFWLERDEWEWRDDRGVEEWR